LKEQINAIRSLSPSSGSPAPEGWVLVPKEPTPEMISAVFCFPLGPRRYWGEVGKETEVVNTDTSLAIYRAMLSAAPSPSGEERKTE
jgi:hypothetical protein